MISVHTAEAFRQVAPVDLTVPKMDILAYVRMWAAMLLMTLLENEDTGVSLPVSSSMQISLVRLVLCADIVVREPTASRWGTWASLPRSPSCGSLFLYCGNGQGQGNKYEHTGWRRLDLATCFPTRRVLPFWPIDNDGNYLPFQTIVSSVHTKLRKDRVSSLS